MDMFSLRLTFKGECRISYIRSSTVCSYRNEILDKARELGARTTTIYEIDFQSEEQLYELNRFISTLL